DGADGHQENAWNDTWAMTPVGSMTVPTVAVITSSKKSPATYAELLIVPSSTTRLVLALSSVVTARRMLTPFFFKSIVTVLSPTALAIEPATRSWTVPAPRATWIARVSVVAAVFGCCQPFSYRCSSFTAAIAASDRTDASLTELSGIVIDSAV